MRNEREAVEMSRQLSAAFYGLDVGQRHNQAMPTAIGVSFRDSAGVEAVAVACPFCGGSHVHRLDEPVEYRGAGCSAAGGYWIIVFEN
jgi:hypothetical protein